ASPTRTPPPICTSAPCLEPRWSEIVGAANAHRCTKSVHYRNENDSGVACSKYSQSSPRSSRPSSRLGICDQNQRFGFAQRDCDIFVEMENKSHNRFKNALSCSC